MLLNWNTKTNLFNFKKEYFFLSIYYDVLLLKRGMLQVFLFLREQEQLIQGVFYFPHLRQLDS